MNEMSVNSIVILNAEVAWISEGRYELTADWSAKYASKTDFLWLIVQKGREVYSTKKVEALGSGTMEISVADPDSAYSLVISDTELPDTEKCEPVELLFDIYEAIAGSYDGSDITLTWKKNEGRIMSGQCVVKTVPAGNAEYCSSVLPRYCKCRTLAVALRIYDEKSALQVWMIPFIRTISSGPVTKSGLLFTDPPVITKLEWVGTASKGFCITAEYSHGYGGESWKDYQVLLTGAILCKGRKLLQSEPAADTGKFVWKIGEDILSLSPKACCFALFLTHETMLSEIKGEHNVISLCRPVIDEVSVMEEGTRISWNYAADGNTLFHLSAGGQVYSTAGRSYLVPAVMDRDLSYSVRAGIGPESAGCSAFCPGYYKGASGLNLCLESMTKTVISFALGDLFKLPLTETVSQGAFSLSKEGIFSVDKTVPVRAEEFDSWMKLLYGHGITPEGAYTMRQCIARTVECGRTQGLYYYAGMSKEKQKADVVPGLFIKLESEQYDSSADGKSIQGMVKGAVSWYGVCLDQKGRLCLNSGLDQMVAEWKPQEVSQRISGQEEVLSLPVPSLLIGGELDFFRSEVRTHYMCIWYPGHFQVPGAGASPYYSDNIVFLAGNDQEALENAVLKLCTDPAQACEEVTAVASGRTSVSLWHPVWINGGQRLIPVGETLGQLCTEYLGAGRLPSLAMKRWAVDRYLPVHEYSRDLILLGGDRIVVEGSGADGQR